MTLNEEQKEYGIEDLLGLINRDSVLLQNFDEAEQARQHLNLTGMCDQQKAYMAAALALRKGKKPTVVVADAGRARAFKSNISAFIDGDVITLYPEDIDYINAVARSHELEIGRTAVLTRILTGDYDALIICAGALLNIYEEPTRFRERFIRVNFGGTINPGSVVKELVSLGYERCATVKERGEFSLRGDVLDVFPPESDYPVRITLFDDSVDMIKTFDVGTQRSNQMLQEIVIGPARQYILNETERFRLAGKINSAAKANAEEIRRDSKAKIADLLLRTAANDSEMAETGNKMLSLNKYSAVLWEKKSSVLEYIDITKNVVFLDEFAEIKARMDAYFADHYSRTQHAYETGGISKIAFDSIYKTPDAMKAIDALRNVIAMAMLPSFSNGLPGGIKAEAFGSATDSYKGNAEKFASDVKALPEDGCCVLMSAGGKRTEKLKEQLSELGILNDKRFHNIKVNLNSGFVYRNIGLMVVGSNDVFGTDSVNRVKKKNLSKEEQAERNNARALQLFADIKPGDYVVHDVHGIGRYVGFEKGLSVGDTIKDYFKIEYADNSFIHVPTDNPNSIQKYVGPNSTQPRLSKLNSKEWENKVNKAKASIKVLAFDLIKLYALRRACKGYSCGPDDVMTKEFEESFPHIETEDQVLAIRDIKNDMESILPMDRLLCGDVGFGKTEVAFRAIVKCVENGKQAFMIAPTTLLAQQHYDNFIVRSRGLGINVALLSRFTPTDRIKGYLEGIKSGRIDVVIGTHRILSKDVDPVNLGLLVVDEEQRFGVNHKETIKNFKNTIDVLTLTATPIPRTLNMSLSGIRDISVLQEPPMNRRPVQTYVIPYDEETIVQAVLREVSRNGQVFYLHNKTFDIDLVADNLSKLMPGVRITYAHGKMTETQLENIVNAFILGDFDVLVCTTIIESGVDMPNVNTMIIEDSDRFGLAQLYQIRGRVGRSDKQAYAYITYDNDPNKVLNEDARKRLLAIRDFTELGSGIKIAMADLEVRGAGDLLGAEQHGHMNVIGYELYCRILDEEVRRLRAESDIKAVAQNDGKSIITAGDVESASDMSDEEKINVLNALMPVNTTVRIDCDSYIPVDYIESDEERINAYRKIALISTLAVYDDFIDELLDRYGEPPQQMYLLAGVSLIRSLGAKAQVEKISFEGKKVYLYFAKNRKINMLAVANLSCDAKFAPLIKIDASSEAHIKYSAQSGNKADQIKEIIELLSVMLRKEE
ncbi:MAG: transcription-repair coupling factor [Clostridia bacterium]|nr:transcription-repair coupling factor [Clostridia bacterium]